MGLSDYTLKLPSHNLIAAGARRREEEREQMQAIKELYIGQAGPENDGTEGQNTHTNLSEKVTPTGARQVTEPRRKRHQGWEGRPKVLKAL